ncbi:hypothetical protein [Paenibacillus sp. SN-8-1]|uniref:hypothetical protein n=1 Tax=Paenibacillus sp. SN-8-1 TaxID=3435409 RepID=UPI003D9A7CED
MIIPKEKEWVICNQVFYADTGALYGYKLRNRDYKTKIISFETGRDLINKGVIEEGLRMELVYITVPRDFKEHIIGEESCSG